MADWKPQISYNYNPTYHAYAYGLMYQPGPEQNNGNLTSWSEDGVVDLSRYNSGVTPNYFAARTRDQSPHGSPEQPAVNGHSQYRSPGVLYLGDTQSGRMLLASTHQTAYDAGVNEVRRPGSESASDSEAHASPDSWSSGSSREGSLPQADPATWAKKDLDDEASSGSPGGGEENHLPDEPRSLAGDEDAGVSLHVPLTAPKKPSTTVANNTKGKARAAFSESQMNTLVQRFSVQRYLTPAEMKNLAEMTGLTYKQVKTWFQNRRMKLRRHQKDTSWVCERYTINKDGPVQGSMYSNVSSHYPGEAQPQLKEHYNHHMVDSAFRKTAPQNLAFYLAAVGSATGSAGYPSWSSNPSQTPVPTRPQVAGWSMPPGVGHYDYNPNAFTPVAANNGVHDTSFESQDGEPVNSFSSLNPSVARNASQ